MDQQTLDYFEEKLLTLQAELLGVADLVNESSRTVDLDQTAVGRVSRIDAHRRAANARNGTIKSTSTARAFVGSEKRFRAY